MHPFRRKCRFCGRVRIGGVLQSLTELKTEQSDGRKSANEPKWEYPLTMVLQGVNIDAFGFAHCKRTQFAVVRDGKRPGSYLCCLLPTKPRAVRVPMCGPRREELGATAKKRANEAKLKRHKFIMPNELYQKTADRPGANEPNLPGDHRVPGARVDHRTSFLIAVPFESLELLR